MSLVDKLLHREKPQPTATVTNAPCAHITLVPKWDSVAEMGHEDRVSSYTCESCQQSFTAAEGRALRESEGERVQQLAQVETPPTPEE